MAEEKEFKPGDTWWVNCVHAENIARMNTRCRLDGMYCAFTGISAPKYCDDYKVKEVVEEDE